MNKFYSMLTAAAVASTMTISAATPVKNFKSEILNAKTELKSNELPTLKSTAKTTTLNKVQKNKSNKFATRAEGDSYTAADIEGLYLAEDNSVGDGAFETSQTIGMIQAINEVDAIYTMMPGLDGYSAAATVDAATNTLSVKLGEPIQVRFGDGTTAELAYALLSTATGAPVIEVGKDLNFKIDKENRYLVWEGDAGADGYLNEYLCLVNYSDVTSATFTGLYGQTAWIELNEVNSDMSYVFLGDDANADASWNGGVCYTEVVDNNLIVNNYLNLGFGYPVMFQLQKATDEDKAELQMPNFEGVATAKDQVLAETRFEAGGPLVPLYLSFLDLNDAGDLAGISTEVNLPILSTQLEDTDEAGNKVTYDAWVLAGSYLAPTAEGEPISLDGTSILAFDKVQVMMYENPFASNSGIKDVNVDNSANGPVEYYNLQGVKLDRPAAGSIVIMRQGNKACKVLVK